DDAPARARIASALVARRRARPPLVATSRGVRLASLRSMEQPKLVHVFPTRLVDGDGVGYVARAFAAPDRNVWDAWLAFFPDDGGKALLTDRETTQPNLEAVRYWAT